MHGLVELAVSLGANRCGELLPDVLAQEILARQPLVPLQPLQVTQRVLVDVGEAPTAVENVEGIGDALQDLPLAPVRLRESLLVPLALVPVLADGDKVVRLPGGVAREGDRQVDPEHRIILVEEALLHRVGFYLARDQSAGLVQVLVEVVGVGPGLDLRPQQVLLGVAEHLAQPAVDPEQRSVGRGVRHADRGLLEGGPESLLTRTHIFLGPLALGNVAND